MEQAVVTTRHQLRFPYPVSRFLYPVSQIAEIRKSRGIFYEQRRIRNARSARTR